MNNKVLILMSTYNGEVFLQEQLNSLKLQEGVEIHYLIRDDGSKDNTKQILQSFSNNNLNVELILGENIGCVQSFASLLKVAYKYCEYIDFFAFCDQDDIWLKQKLSMAIEKLKLFNLEKPTMYCSNLFLIDEKGKRIGEKYRRGDVRFSKGSSLVESIATGCTMVFNKKAVEIFTNYPPNYMTMHDLWIFHMCIFFGEIFYDDEPYILYRQHSNNVIGSKSTLLSKWRSRIKSFKNLSSQNYRELEAKEMLRIYENLLLDEDKKLISIVSNYRRDLFSKWKFLFATKKSGLNMSNVELNFWLKLRIIFNCV